MLLLLILNKLRVCLGSTYFTETEKIAENILNEGKKLTEKVQLNSWIVPKSVVRPMNNSKNKLNNKII